MSTDSLNYSDENTDAEDHEALRSEMASFESMQAEFGQNFDESFDDEDEEFDDEAGHSF